MFAYVYPRSIPEQLYPYQSFRYVNVNINIVQVYDIVKVFDSSYSTFTLPSVTVITSSITRHKNCLTDKRFLLNLF